MIIFVWIGGENKKMIFHISYDLKNPGRNYSSLYEEIKKLGSSWCHVVDSTWYVDTRLNSIEIRDRLTRVMDNSDELIITSVGKDGAWFNLSNDISSWLKQHLL